jgi:hypothetical protein
MCTSGAKSGLSLGRGKRMFGPLSTLKAPKLLPMMGDLITGLAVPSCGNGPRGRPMYAMMIFKGPFLDLLRNICFGS